MRSNLPTFKRNSNTLLFAAVLSVLVLSAAPAFAAGFFLPTRGVESTSRGGASIAPHAGDLNAIWYNPAGLSLLDDRQLTVDLGVVGVNVRFQRAPREMPDGTMRTYEEVRNEAPPGVIPQILVGGPTRFDNITWAFGAYTPYAASGRYPVDGPQRYVLVDNVGSALGYLHLAAAWQVNDQLALGFGLQNFIGSFRVVTVGSGYAGMFGDPEDDDLDMLAVATINSFFTPTANLGMTYRFSERIQTGLSVQLPHRFRDRNATIDARVPDHPAYDNAEVTDNRVDIAMTFPFYVRGGVRYVADTFDVEFGLVYQHWSFLQDITSIPHDADVTGVPGVGDVRIDPFVIPKNFTNTFSAHFGGAYHLDGPATLRAGYVFERGAIPDTHYSVFDLDPNKHQLSLGLGYDFGRLQVDAMLAALIMPSKHITNSQVRQVNPSDEDGDLTIVVANGHYHQFGYLGGVGLTYQF